MFKLVHARTIIEDEEVRVSVEEYHRQYPRFEEAFEALKWLLARRCDDVQTLTCNDGGIDYYIYRTSGDEIAKTPDILVLFTFDDSKVTLHGIQAKKSEETPD